MSDLSDDREFNSTASQAPTICNGSAGDILDLWLERTKQKAPPDLTRNLAVQLGKQLEGFLVDWMEIESGHYLTERQHHIRHPKHSYFSATLDALDAADQAVLEFKVLSPWRKRKDIINWYTPQVVTQMECRGVDRGYLCVLQGNDHIDKYEIVVDDTYRRQMWERIAAFQLCVDTQTAPVPLPAPLVPPEQWKTIDLNRMELPLPNWAAAIEPALKLWAETKDAFDDNEKARADIKALMPSDCGELLWNELTLLRNRRGAITIKREETT